MSRGFPSMTALLGLLAVAGYQNRDQLAEMLRGGSATGAPGQPNSGPLGGLLGGLGGAGAGGLLSGGLGQLLDQFRQNGEGDVADSWVRKGPNAAIEPPRLEKAIGADTLDALTRQTGLTRQEILNRLSRELPDAVDRYTPDGRLPADA